jgi:hypothetical protein
MACEPTKNNFHEYSDKEENPMVKDDLPSYIIYPIIRPDELVL